MKYYVVDGNGRHDESLCPLTSRLGLAYAGSARNDIIEVLTPVMWDANSSFEVTLMEEF